MNTASTASAATDLAQIVSTMPDPAQAGKARDSADDIITILGPFMAIDSRGRPWAIEGAYIDSEGYIPDLYVQLSETGVREAELYDDEAFITCVLIQLRDVGYAGEEFGRAELGMQSDGHVVMEPCQDFYAFAATRGFKLLEI